MAKGFELRNGMVVYDRECWSWLVVLAIEIALALSLVVISFVVDRYIWIIGTAVPLYYAQKAYDNYKTGWPRYDANSEKGKSVVKLFNLTDSSWR